MTDSERSNGWYGEPERIGFRQLFLVKGELYSGRSAFQEIRVLDTVPFGRSLILDGAVQTTEADEFIYHEMLVHVPLVLHPEPRDVLLIGGGDGGALRRILEHGVQRVVQVEIDEEVVRVSRLYLPSISNHAYDDPRVNLTIGNGVDYIGSCPPEEFDAVLIDSTDPVGPAAALYTADFFMKARSVLRPGGVFVTQSGSPLLMARELHDAYSALCQVFGQCFPYLAPVPSYPGVLWSFLLATREPFQWPGTDSVRERWQSRGLSGAYCNPAVAMAAFAIPGFVRDELASLDTTRHPLFG